MSDENASAAVLRRSLDAIDHLRRRALWVGWLVVLGTAGAYGWLYYVARTSPDPKRLIVAAVLALTFVIAWSTFALTLFIARMTARILRAIDLASRQ